jgi:hypothetical protein
LCTFKLKTINKTIKGEVGGPVNETARKKKKTTQRKREREKEKARDNGRWGEVYRKTGMHTETE